MVIRKEIRLLKWFWSNLSKSFILKCTCILYMLYKNIYKNVCLDESILPAIKYFLSYHTFFIYIFSYSILMLLVSSFTFLPYLLSTQFQNSNNISKKWRKTDSTILQPLSVFVRGRSMHILDIPLACLTHPSTPFSISLSHFLSSVSLKAESNRAHQTGWSEQNGEWHCPADSLWNTLKPCQCMWMLVCCSVCNCLHASKHFVGVGVCKSVYVCLYLSSRLSLPEMKGRRKMTS